MSTRAAHGAGSRTIIRREIRARRLSRVRAQVRALRLWIAAVVLMACGVCGVSFEAKSRTELFDKLRECVGACNLGYLKDDPSIIICYVNATIPGDMTQDWMTGTGENCIDEEENDLNISNWNVEKVETMRHLFRNARKFNQNIGSWDVGKISDMRLTFYNATSFNQPLHSWDTSTVTSMSGAFFNASSFNQPLNSWDTSSVTSMLNIFGFAHLFNQPLNSWNTSNIVATYGIFWEAHNVNHPVGLWDISTVSDMTGTFNNARRFNQPLASWDTSRAITMENLFLSAHSFNQPVGSWDVARVSDLKFAFYDAKSFNQPLSKWDTSKVTTMPSMFAFALSFKQPLNALATWDVARVQSFENSFYETPFERNNSVMCDSLWVTAAAKRFFSSSFSFVERVAREPCEFTDLTLTKTVVDEWLTNSDPKIRGHISDWNVSFVTTAYNSSLFAAEEDHAFNDDLSKWDTARAVTMANMFIDAASFNGNLSLWETNKVTTMKSMFQNAPSFNGDVSTWDTRNVADMRNMFLRASAFDQDLGAWNVQHVTTMDRMFEDAASFNGNLSTWSTSSLTSMQGMFRGAVVFDRPLEELDVSRVTNMRSMFQSASSFNQPLALWDVSRVATMVSMFEGAVAFNQFCHDDWVTAVLNNDTINGSNISLNTSGIFKSNSYAGPEPAPECDIKSDSTDMNNNNDNNNNNTPLIVRVDPNLLRITVVLPNKKRSSASTRRALTNNVRGGEKLILYGRGQRKWTPLSSTSSTPHDDDGPLDDGGTINTAWPSSYYSFLPDSHVELCISGGRFCTNVTNASVAEGGRSINVSMPAFTDMKAVKAADLQGYMSVRVLVSVDPLPPSSSFSSPNKDNVTIDCRGHIVSPAYCSSYCDGGATGSRGCPAAAQGGGLYLLPDTCAEYKKDDYTMCLDPDMAALCGYHVVHKTSQKEKDTGAEITCKPCPPAGLCPGGPRIWPRAGYWVAEERPPTVESGRSADPLACPAPSHERCLGWDVDTLTTKCGSEYAPGVYLCAECKRGSYSTLWNRSCSPCIGSGSDSDGSGDGQNRDAGERMIVVACVLSILSLLALCVVLVATFVGGDRGQGMYRARRFFLFSLSSMQIVAQISQQATGYEDQVVLKLFGYINMITTLDSTDALPPECWDDATGGPFLLPNCAMVGVLVMFGIWAWLSCAPQKQRWCCLNAADDRGVPKRIHISYRIQRFFLSILTLLYPMTTRNALTYVTCARITAAPSVLPSDGESDEVMVYVLRSRPSIQCFGEAHAATGYMACLTLVLFCVGYPACLLWLVKFSSTFDHSAAVKVGAVKVGVPVEGKGGSCCSYSCLRTMQTSKGRKKADTIAEDEVSPEVSAINPMMFRKSRLNADASKGTVTTAALAAVNKQASEVVAAGSTNSLFSKKKKTRAGKLARGRGEKRPGSADGGGALGKNSMFAFVRMRKELLFAFKPLIQSDYKLGYLTFRPMYLVMIFVLACGTAIAPPSSRYAALRAFLSLAVITMYYSALAWSRPMRHNRRWVLPVVLSICFVSILALGLTAVVETRDLQEEGNVRLVRGLSLAVVVCVVFLIAFLIPFAAIYEIVAGAKRDVRNEQLRTRLKSQCALGNMSKRELAARLFSMDMAQDFGVAEELVQQVAGAVQELEMAPVSTGGDGREAVYDEASGWWYTVNNRSGSTRWLEGVGDEEGEEVDGGAYEEESQQEQDDVAYGDSTEGGEAKEIHLDEESGAYYSYNSRSGSTRWLDGHGGEELGSNASHEAEALEGGENDATKAADEGTETYLDAESGAYYSYNTKSGSMRWLQEVVDTAGVPLDAASENEGILSIDMATLESVFSVDESQSRGEWSVMVEDTSGRTVYFNRRTKQVLGQRPKGWVRMLADVAEGGKRKT